MTTPDFAHLNPSMRLKANFPDQERIHIIRSTKVWIGHKHAQEALSTLNRIFTYGPDQVRPPYALVVSPSNNGKSSLLDRFQREHAGEQRAGKNSDAEIVPVLIVQMPDDPTVSRLYRAILRKLGAPVSASYGRTDHRAELECLTFDVLRNVGIRVLIIDELHNMLSADRRDRGKLIVSLRYIGNELLIPVIGVGTRDAHLAIRTDDQLENRFQPIVLPLWEADEVTATMMASYTAHLPLRMPSPDLCRMSVLQEIVDRTGGTIGEILSFLRDAAVAAIETGEEALTHAALRKAKYAGPKERRAAVDPSVRRQAM